MCAGTHGYKDDKILQSAARQRVYLLKFYSYGAKLQRWWKKTEITYTNKEAVLSFLAALTCRWISVSGKHEKLKCAFIHPRLRSPYNHYHCMKCCVRCCTPTPWNVKVPMLSYCQAHSVCSSYGCAHSHNYNVISFIFQIPLASTLVVCLTFHHCIVISL